MIDHDYHFNGFLDLNESFLRLIFQWNRPLNWFYRNWDWLSLQGMADLWWRCLSFIKFIQPNWLLDKLHAWRIYLLLLHHWFLLCSLDITACGSPAWTMVRRRSSSQFVCLYCDHVSSRLRLTFFEILHRPEIWDLNRRNISLILGTWWFEGIRFDVRCFFFQIGIIRSFCLIDFTLSSGSHFSFITLVDTHFGVFFFFKFLFFIWWSICLLGIGTLAALLIHHNLFRRLQILFFLGLSDRFILDLFRLLLEI